MIRTLDLAHLPGLEPRLARIAPVVAEWLRTYAPGRGEAKPKGVCTAGVRSFGARLSVRDFEAICHALACAGHEVGTSTKGYFWCLDDEDFAVAEAWLLPRFQPQRARYEGLHRRRAERFGPPKLF